MFLFIVLSSVSIILPGTCIIVYSQIWFKHMLISDNPVSLDNLYSFEKPNFLFLSVIGRSRYAKFIYVLRKLCKLAK